MPVPPSPSRPAPRVDPRIDQTRRLVKEATLRLITEVGFEGTTVELIAERSGVSRSTIYRHWPDPSVLYLEAFDPPSDELDRPPTTGDTVADLRAYVRHVADRLNDELFAAALAVQIDKARRDPAYREAQLRYAVARNDYGVGIFARGVAQGDLARSIDPEHETDLVLGYLVYQRIVRHRTLDDALVDELYQGVLRRCLAAPGAPARPRRSATRAAR